MSSTPPIKYIKSFLKKQEMQRTEKAVTALNVCYVSRELQLGDFARFVSFSIWVLSSTLHWACVRAIVVEAKINEIHGLISAIVWFCS